jgi:hypothetical protein
VSVITRRIAGAPFVAGRTGWPEVPSLRLHDAGAEIRLFIAAPAGAVVDAVGHGMLRCGWIGSERGSLLCLSLRDVDQKVVLPWFAVPYHARNDAHDGLEGLPEDFPAGSPLRVTLLLVDADSGLNTAVSDHLWPGDIADELRATITGQLGHQNSNPASATMLGELRRSYPSGPEGIEAMVRDLGLTWDSRPA